MTIPAPWISQLTRAFVRKNNLSPSDLDVTDARDPKFVSQSDQETGDKNMKATFIFKSSGGNYQGSELFEYKTVNLEKLFLNNSIPVVWGYNPHTTKDIAQMLIDQYGLPMHVDWFVEEPVDGSLLPTHYTIKTKSTDWSSASQLTVRVEQSEKDVAELFTETALDTPIYPITTVGSVYDNPAHMLVSYPKDFTPFYEDERQIMREFKVGDRFRTIDNPVFHNFLERIVGDDAVVRVTSNGVSDVGVKGQLNMHFCNIEYNGTTKGYVYWGISADTSYDNVLVIWPTPTTDNDRRYNLTPMFLHYNDV